MPNMVKRLPIIREIFKGDHNRVVAKKRTRNQILFKDTKLKRLLFGDIKVICNYLKECGLFYKI